MPFGGSVKLTGESEYRQAIKNITNDLKGMSKALKDQSADFSANNKSMSSNVDAQKKLNDIIKDQQSQIDKAKTALAGYSVTLQGQQAKHNALTREYRNAVLELEKIKKASGETSEAYKQQESVVDKLGVELADSTNEMNKSKSAMSALKSEINNSQRTIDSTQKSLDELGNEAEDAGEKAKRGGDGFTVMKGALANLASGAISMALNGLKQLGGAFVSIGKQAYANYGEYEQLVGGVETLFGTSSKKLIEYAQGAYKTAGLSANQYMEQATGFSATLLQGLGGDTEKAVQYADMAIKDMADNANKMGTDMYMIQNAYQGFAKDNYTMLDNLKLGYGGTQSEMARLINDSGVLGDAVEVTAQTVKDVPFDKIIEAIHKTQQEIGITGTTTLEAEKTIQGSTAAMKAAWENLLTGIADEDQDISPLVDNFVEQVIAMGQNSAPRIKQIVQGIGEVVNAMWNEVLPQLADSVPELEPFISKLLWIKDNSGAIGVALGGIAAAFVGMKIVSAINQISMLVGAIKGLELASKLAAIKTVVLEGAQKAAAAASTVMAGAQTVLNAVMTANPIGLVIAGIVALVAAFVLLWNKSEGFRNFWIGLWEKIKDVAGKVAEWFSETWSSVVDWFKDAWETIKESALNTWNGIKDVFSTVAQWMNDNVFTPIMNFFKPVITFFSEAWQIISELGKGSWEAIKLIWSAVKEWFDTSVIQPVKTFFTDLWNVVKTTASDTWNAIVEVWQVVSTWFNENIIIPVSDFFTGLWETITTKASEAWTFLQETWQVVSGWFNDTIITPVVDYFSGMWDRVKSGAKDAWSGVKSTFASVADWFREKFSKAWQNVKKVFSTGGKVFDGIKEGITSAFKTVVNAIIRGINKVVAIPFNAINRTLDKIRNVSILGAQPFSGLISRFSVPQIPLLEQGGILKRGQIGLLEGNGTEAVVPLEQNTQWTNRVASQITKQLEQSNLRSDTQTMNYDTIVSAFKDALSQVKVELDDDEVGSFVDRTVTKLVYN